jgi:hypothetical protein
MPLDSAYYSSNHSLQCAMSRTRLLQLASQLDRLLAEADSILAAPVFADIGVLAEDLRASR